MKCLLPAGRRMARHKSLLEKITRYRNHVFISRAFVLT